jgi:hypothetical protein
MHRKRIARRVSRNAAMSLRMRKLDKEKDEIIKKVSQIELSIFEENPNAPYFLRSIVEGEFDNIEKDKTHVLVAWNGPESKDKIHIRVPITKDEYELYSEKTMDIETFQELLKRGIGTFFVKKDNV